MNLLRNPAPMASEPAFALETRGLCVQLGGKAVLNQLNVAIPSGQWSCIVGPNGAGKSTLLKALAGLHLASASSGEVRLHGQSLHALPLRQRAQALAWLGQNPSVSSDACAYDVVMLGRLPHQGWLGAPNLADHAACERAMRQLQCWEWRTRSLGTLSGGERQRVLLARLLAVDAQVLLMDEPLANLDPPQQADWLALSRSLTAQGKTLVTVLHELTLAMQADKLLVLAGGQLRHFGSTQAASTREALSAAFDGRIALHEVAGHWVALPH